MVIWSSVVVKNNARFEYRKIGSQLARPPAKSCGDLLGPDGGLEFFVFSPKLLSPKR